MAFHYFAMRQVEVAVIETGLGGRLDATNVLVPELTMTTDVSLDHTEILGSTLAQIAAEKGGIIKPLVPHVSAKLPPEASRVIKKLCKAQGTEYIGLRTTDYQIDRQSKKLTFESDGLTIGPVKPSLPGVHQLTNCALALKAIACLRSRGWKLPVSAIGRGLRRIEWPGRFQIISSGGSGPTMVLDVCHNAAGGLAFAETFTSIFPGKKCHVLVGFVKRKAHQELVSALAPLALSFTLVPLATGRSVATADLLAALDWHGVSVSCAGRLETALRKLGKLTQTDDIICIVGSHYLVGEYLGRFGPR